MNIRCILTLNLTVPFHGFIPVCINVAQQLRDEKPSLFLPISAALSGFFCGQDVSCLELLDANSVGPRDMDVL